MLHMLRISEMLMYTLKVLSGNGNKFKRKFKIKIEYFKIKKVQFMSIKVRHKKAYKGCYCSENNIIMQDGAGLAAEES